MNDGCWFFTHVIKIEFQLVQACEDSLLKKKKGEKALQGCFH